ncbi:ATP-dependent (S)-NAD(P)H-hydrate dehydratase isoform X1 [Ciona intestinalis]
MSTILFYTRALTIGATKSQGLFRKTGCLVANISSNRGIISIVPRTNQPQKLFKMQEEETSLLEEARKVVPALSFGKHKGQAGRVGVIGGSEEYTGAPYFAAISAMKAGADLAHVFCSKSASTVIKSYSPELIVHPLLDAPNAVTLMDEWLPRIHSHVIGPGLGRVDATLNTVKEILIKLKKQEIPIVIDADGLFLITRDPSIIHGYTKAILTPNVVEFQRLSKAMNLNWESKDLNGSIMETVALSKALGGVTIVRKGEVDIVATGDEVVTMDEIGSPRRCGGQGDLLSGVMALFSYWTHNSTCTPPPTLLAGYAACFLTKRCANQAFQKHGRSTTTTDLISEINSVFANNFENPTDPKS